MMYFIPSLQCLGTDDVLLFLGQAIGYIRKSHSLCRQRSGYEADINDTFTLAFLSLEQIRSQELEMEQLEKRYYLTLKIIELIFI